MIWMRLLLMERNKGISRKNRAITSNHNLTSDNLDLNVVKRLHLLESIYGKKGSNQISEIRNQIKQSSINTETSATEEYDGKITVERFHRSKKGNKHSR